ncbi:MAG: hypothetical protein ACE5KA_09410, partial [Nitrososphaerales archaeon]
SSSDTHLKLSAIWSNVREYVEHYKTIFGNLWDGSSEISKRIEMIERQAQLERFAEKMRGSLKDLGYEMKKSIDGISGLTHDFHTIATNSKTKDTIVIEMNTSKRKEEVLVSLVNFVAKCIDVEAKNKLYVTMLAADDLEELASAYSNSVKIVDVESVQNYLAMLKKEGVATEYSCNTVGRD